MFSIVSQCLFYRFLDHGNLEDAKIGNQKDRQYNGQKKKYKRTNNDLQNITHKTNDRATRTPLKLGMNSGVPEGWAIPAPHEAPVV